MVLMKDNTEHEVEYLHCPKCHQPMAQVTFGGITVDRCTECNGIWFDSQEEAKLKDMRGAHKIEGARPPTAIAQKHNQMAHVSCPRCDGHIEMTRLVVPSQAHIWYESCPSCRGIYFDAGEFADFRAYTPLDVIKNLFAKKRD